MNDKTEVQKIYDAALKEHDEFMENMRMQDIDYIIDHAYEIIIKNDLIMHFECVADYGTEDDYKYRELAKLTHPLETLFVDWCKREDDHMENLRYSIEETANKSLRDIIVNQNNKDLELDDYER